MRRATPPFYFSCGAAKVLQKSPRGRGGAFLSVFFGLWVFLCPPAFLKPERPAPPSRTLLRARAQALPAPLSHPCGNPARLLRPSHLERLARQESRRGKPAAPGALDRQGRQRPPGADLRARAPVRPDVRAGRGDGRGIATRRAARGPARLERPHALPRRPPGPPEYRRLVVGPPHGTREAPDRRRPRVDRPRPRTAARRDARGAGVGPPARALRLRPASRARARHFSRIRAVRPGVAARARITTTTLRYRFLRRASPSPRARPSPGSSSSSPAAGCCR